MKLHLLFHFNQLTFICDFNVCREFDVYRFRTKHLKRKNGLALFLITGKTAVRNYNTDTKKRKNVFLKADVALKEIWSLELAHEKCVDDVVWRSLNCCGLCCPCSIELRENMFGFWGWPFKIHKKTWRCCFQSRGRLQRQASILKPLLAGMFSGWKKQCIHSFSLILVYASKSLGALKTLLA